MNRFTQAFVRLLQNRLSARSRGPLAALPLISAVLASTFLGTPLFGQVPPNDSLFAKQWYLNNTGVNVVTGETTWTKDADIQVLDAWTITRGDSNVVVVTIDTGMDVDHEDLSGNLLARGNEVWDFVCDGPFTRDCFPPYLCDPDPIPNDDYQGGHGTAVAGITSAVRNNGLGVSGIAPGCRIMPLRVYISTAQINASRAYAIKYAADKFQTGQFAAMVINGSWHAIEGGDFNRCCDEDEPGFCDDHSLDYLATQIRRADSLGCVVVFASGNESELSLVGN